MFCMTVIINHNIDFIYICASNYKKSLTIHFFIRIIIIFKKRQEFPNVKKQFCNLCLMADALKYLFVKVF